MVEGEREENSISEDTCHRAQQGVEHRELVRIGGKDEDVLVEEQ